MSSFNAGANQTKWFNEWFLLPSSLRLSELRAFVNSTEKMGSFSFMWFMIIILSLFVYLFVASIYEYWFAVRKRIERQYQEAKKCDSPLWMSIYDYHTKLTPSQQSAYLDYSQRMFELQRCRLEKENLQLFTAQNAHKKAKQEVNLLKFITQWTCKKAHFPLWSHRHQQQIYPESMV